jgi:hypothetical protein
LALSAVLGFIALYIFAVFGFYFFSSEFYNTEENVDECQTLLLCFSTMLHSGLLSGGGISDHISGDLGHYPNYNESR